MESKTIPSHDLKTDRPGISGGLPSIYRLVPIAFFLCVTAGVLLNGANVYRFQQYKSRESEYAAITESENEQKSQLMAKQSVLAAEIDEAEGVASWLKGARPVQQMVLKISRSFGANSTISELSLTRNPEIPEHTVLTLKINGDPVRQLEQTISALNEIEYYTYSAQQVLGDNAMDYQATLVGRGEAGAANDESSP